MNLNIDKFSKNDLLDIFNISENQQLSYNSIQNKCQKYISDINNNNSLPIATSFADNSLVTAT